MGAEAAQNLHFSTITHFLRPWILNETEISGIKLLPRDWMFREKFNGYKPWIDKLEEPMLGDKAHLRRQCVKCKCKKDEDLDNGNSWKAGLEVRPV